MTLNLSMSDDTHKSPPKSDVKAPIPISGHGASIPRVSSQYSLRSQDEEEPPRSFTPGIAQTLHRSKQNQFRRRPSYNTIEGNRERHYNLDYPEDKAELQKLQLDPNSRFFARTRPRTLDLPSMLPYKIESPKDQAKFLSHIVSHLYIAIKTLDLQGSLSVSANELAALKDLSNGSDVDLALETNLFEMNSASETNFDEDGNYFSNDESDSDEDEDEEDDELGADGGMEDDGETTNQHKKSPKSAAIIGVKTWTHELLVWLKMKYDMPVSLKVSLAKVYYSLALSRGQHLNLKTYVKTFDLLTKESHLLREHGLSLPWEALHNELISHFPSIDSTLDPIEKKDHKQLLSLASKASVFFDDDSLPLVYAKLGSRFSIANASLVLSSMSLLPLRFTKGGMEDPKDIRHYLASFFYMWKKLSKSSGFDSQITSRLGLVAMSALFKINDVPDSISYIKIGDYGIFSKDQMKFMINTLTNSLSIMIEKYSSMKTKFFHGFASTIVYSINGGSPKTDGIIENLRTLLNAIQSYVHPSNNGEWSRPISKLVLSLIYQFHKRYCSENEIGGTLNHLPNSIKLSRDITDEFVSMFLPIVKIGIQSKKASSTEDHLTSLQLLAYLNPTMVLENMLLDIYESLEGVISTHRVIIALRSIEPLARFFASTPIYRVHLIRLLLLSLPGIDSNDLEKTLHTLDAFSSVANFVPFCDLSDGEDDPSFSLQFTQSHLQYLERKLYLSQSADAIDDLNFDVDEETELRALKSSTSAFKSLIKSLNQRLFLLFENLPDPSKTEGIERDLVSSIPKYIYVLLESFSDDVYKSFQKEFFDFVFNNTYHTIADVTAEICGGIIKRDPKSFRIYGPQMIDRIREEIEENGAGQSRTGVDILPRDQNLFWNLVILNECIGNAGSEVLRLADDLMSLSYFLMENVKGPVVFASSYLINQVLQSVTKIRLKENRLISPLYVQKHGVSEKCWGGFQFDNSRFAKENITFEWFTPGEKEVQFAVDSFNDHVIRCLKNILQLMKDFKADNLNGGSIQLTDDIRTNLLYIGYSLSGISYLLDPSFDEDIPQLNHENESIEKRLLLLKQIRNAKSVKEDDEGLDISDNLEKIMENLSTDCMEIDQYDGSKEVSNEADVNELISSNDLKSDSTDGLKLSSRSTSPMDIEVPESSSTPQVDDVDISSINPSSTFRERKLYTSYYYFGDDIETRKSNELYLKLHKTHHFVGKSLHVICKFLTTHFHDNTKLFKHLLYVINIWFSDVGRERILDSSHSKIHYGYISCIQSINNIRKPYTRIAIGSRIEAYHSLRVSLHSTSRTQTQLDKWLLEDIVKLSLSTYTTISSPAQSLLVDVMKRVGGAYNVIIRTTFKLLSKVLEDVKTGKSNSSNKKGSDKEHLQASGNEKIIESGLNVFTLKRVKSKLHNDYFNLQKYIEILLKCQEIDSFEVQTLSQKLLEGVYTYITVPSNICIIDIASIDTIRPPDEFIDLEVKIIRLAKEKKRKIYFEKVKKIEEFVIAAEKIPSHWKTTSMNLNMLISLQSELEIGLESEVLKILLEKSSSDHPLISRLSLKGLTRIINKLYLLQGVDYDLKKAYDLEFVGKDYTVVDTTPKDGKSYYETWDKELKNTENPSFYVDFRASVGWMFWDKTMVVNSSEPCFNLALIPSDAEILKQVCGIISKTWLLDIVKLWITDNEANSAFQGTDVFFTSTLLLLMSNGYVTNLKFQDLLEIIEEVYVEDDKSVHIVICELISGILLGSKWLDPLCVEARDNFITQFLSKILANDLSPDNRGVWNIFSWWLPSHIDIRRFPKIIGVITNFTIDKDSDSVVRQATRISYMRSLLTSITWNYSDPDAVLQFCLDNINHRYEAIRTQIGSLMAVLSFPYYGESKANSTEFVLDCNEKKNLVLYSESEANKLLSLIPELFTRIEAWRKDVVGLSPQEILKSDYIYTATTILTWLRQELNTSVGILFQRYVDNYIIPFLLKLINMKEVCQLGNIDPITVFKKVSQIQYDGQYLERVVIMLEKYSSEELNVVQSIIMGEFTETFYFKNLFKLTTQQRRRIINLTNHMVYHKNVEIRESEASTLSGLIHISPPMEVEEFVKESISSYTKDLDSIRKKYKKIGYKSIESDDIRILHGATLGLGALVHAFSFSSPPPKWVPEILATLANKSSGLPGIIGKTAKNTLGKFKKDRQDTWHIDSKVFNEYQMQDLEGVLWKSYFI
ncbi:uncharacterized protein CANTADRAFT_88150 [Suhomyces tanzawaensis NRRL Y-17324]|uniref:Proteasome activator BLM10 n=1 Tax=Suhomyces tanzawaensis NRRL Y-17324 TaxID=984487 RepID=A0A1E4SRT5_9ASCO|nr:uncharacterized protein CANTADRAFT_88150 [Suhomyces tanzawaensis NRRL Y-17324]ODV82229.1 hypothetical protein CANTADRAFT_88150 [Suhomyces tanzawaensis NRRL Y-17324]